MKLPNFLGKPQALPATTVTAEITDEGGDEGEERLLSFPGEEQRLDNWCWAAVSSGIANYYDNQAGTSQQSVAHSLCQSQTWTNSCQNNRCASARTPPCNRAIALEGVLRLIRHHKQTLRAFTIGDSAPWLPFDVIKSAIENDEAHAIRIQWDGGTNGHFVTLIGYKTGRDGAQIVVVHDPSSTYTGSDNQHEVPYTDLCADYPGGGTWTHSYLTR